MIYMYQSPLRLETVSRTDLRIIFIVQVLTEKNTRLSRELEECKTQLQAAVAALQEQKKPPVGNIYFKEWWLPYRLRRVYRSNN